MAADHAIQTMAFRALIVDASASMCQAIRRMLKGDAAAAIVGAAQHGQQAVGMACRLRQLSASIGTAIGG